MFCFGITTAQHNQLVYYTDFDLALELAAEQDKDVFAFIGPKKSFYSKRIDIAMSDKGLVDYINQNFIPVRLRHVPRTRFIKRTIEQTYPLLKIYDSEANILYNIHKCCDEITKEQIIQASELARTRPYEQLDFFKANYKHKKQDPAFLKEYLELAKKLADKKLIDKILDEYANVYYKESDEEWMNFVMNTDSGVESKLFDVLLRHKNELEQEFGEQEVQDFILNKILNDISNRPSEISVEDYIGKVMKQVSHHKTVIKDEYLMAAIARRKFIGSCRCFKIKNDQGEFAMRLLDSYAEWLDDKTLMDVIWDIAVYVNKPRYLTSALDNLDYLMSKKESLWYFDLKSVLLYKLGQEEESYYHVAQAQKLASENSEDYESSLRYLKNQGHLE